MSGCLLICLIATITQDVYALGRPTTQERPWIYLFRFTVISNINEKMEAKVKTFLRLGTLFYTNILR